MNEVLLMYFRPSGAHHKTWLHRTRKVTLADVVDEVINLRRVGALPGLPVNAGHDLYIMIDMQQAGPLFLCIPPHVDSEDVTPIMGVPLARLRLKHDGG